MEALRTEAITEKLRDSKSSWAAAHSRTGYLYVHVSNVPMTIHMYSDCIVSHRYIYIYIDMYMPYAHTHIYIYIYHTIYEYLYIHIHTHTACAFVFLYLCLCEL